MDSTPPRRKMRYERDMRGYGRNPPDPRWPGGAHVAVQFVVNYEEGGENCVLHGDAASEAFLSEIVGAAAWQGMRHWNMESIYEYGARAGFWRLHRVFAEAGVPVTCYGVATALARSPEVVPAVVSRRSSTSKPNTSIRPPTSVRSQGAHCTSSCANRPAAR